jgi:hypothetical protein
LIERNRRIHRVDINPNPFHRGNEDSKLRLPIAEMIVAESIRAAKSYNR